MCWERFWIWLCKFFGLDSFNSIMLLLLVCLFVYENTCGVWCDLIFARVFYKLLKLRFVKKTNSSWLVVLQTYINSDIFSRESRENENEYALFLLEGCRLYLIPNKSNWYIPNSRTTTNAFSSVCYVIVQIINPFITMPKSYHYPRKLLYLSDILFFFYITI